MFPYLCSSHSTGPPRTGPGPNLSDTGDLLLSSICLSQWSAAAEESPVAHHPTETPPQCAVCQEGGCSRDCMWSDYE